MKAFNFELHNKVIEQIENNPENWNQFVWDKKSCRCYGGWALTLAGLKINRGEARFDAQRVLGLTTLEVFYAFDPNKILEELKALPEYVRINRENSK